MASPNKINTENIERKMQGVSNTQDSIQSLSLWAIHHKSDAKQIVDVWLKVVKRGTTIYWLCLLISHLLVVLSVDRIILSFRKPFLSFYIYLLLIWLCLFLILLSNDRTTSCSKSWDRYHFGSAAISVDFYVYTPFLWYRGVYFVCSYALQRHPPVFLFIYS